eukprot:gnl/MRDRNA2_/MRDRNA2_141128_c0_seq1.p1 gnl/MRDRNA2_/MRDRNA2_141128_c0~~gnl/MRDRNA2_/MRDRNA2_141128_c0_seq1.p1  ORF type:complete len:286 (+),score=76.99 gnl/MRDRNA2_/MRDRNA2_141128_c0_seq1:718-1575(+)
MMAEGGECVFKAVEALLKMSWNKDGSVKKETLALLSQMVEDSDERAIQADWPMLKSAILFHGAPAVLTTKKENANERVIQVESKPLDNGGATVKERSSTMLSKMLEVFETHAIEAVLNIWQDGDASVKANAFPVMLTIVEMCDKRAFQAMLDMLDDADVIVKIQAFFALWNVVEKTDELTSDALLKSVQAQKEEAGDTSEKFQTLKFFTALVEKDEERAIEALIKLPKDPNASARSELLDVLKTSKDDAVSMKVVSLLLFSMVEKHSTKDWARSAPEWYWEHGSS